MSLLGIDVGTTGCKALVFSDTGEVLGSSYAEYAAPSTQGERAEIDPREVWMKVAACVREAAAGPGQGDPVRAVSVASLGESVVSVDRGRSVLGTSMLMNDRRGEEYLPALREKITDRELFAINGNVLGNHYSLTKLMWLRDNEPERHEGTEWYLHFSGYISHLLGAEPAVDYSLANRTLLFDIHSGSWSEGLCTLAGIDQRKLPPPVPSGTVIGHVSARIAAELGLPQGIPIAAGAHDQTANAVGAGVTEPGCAMYGMGTYACIVPVFTSPPDTASMISLGLNVEHHAVAGRYVCFVYNPGGSIVRWYRDTFATSDTDYSVLMAELPQSPSPVLVLPHFTQTGPPSFIADSAGMVAGLRLDTSRADILKGLLESITFSLRHCVDGLPRAGVNIDEYRVVGGGSRSDAWVQLSCDILGVPCERPMVNEAGALGAAVMAGTGAGVYPSMAEGARVTVRPGARFEPDRDRGRIYAERYQLYTELYPALADILQRV